MSTWLVEFAVEPPASVITLNNSIVQIEAYVGRSPASAKARVWLDIKPKPRREIVLGQICEETDHQFAMASSAMEVEVRKHLAPATRGERQRHLPGPPSAE